MSSPAVPPVDESSLPRHSRPRLTLIDVARAMGVSRTTVSNAFNRPEQLSEVLREDILAKARELGYYGPDTMARAMRRRELREVGVVFHHDLSYALSDPASTAFLRGVASELDARHLTMQLIPKMGRKLMLTAAFQTTADSLIVYADIGPEFVPELQAAQKPLVLVDAVVPGMRTVGVDDRLGAVLAMSHALKSRPDVVIVLSFLKTDEERAVVLAQSVPPDRRDVGSERTAGFAAAARDAGFPMDRLVWLSIDDWMPETAGERVNEVRSQLPPGSRVAIVAMSDRFALAAQAAVTSWHEHEIVAIVGFDDIPAAEPAGLTTVRQDQFLKGQLCVRVVLDDVQPELMPVELVVRNT